MATSDIAEKSAPESLDFSKIKNYRRNIFSWSMYDLANTIYSMGIVSLTIAPLLTILAIAYEAGIDPSDLIGSEIEVTKAQFDEGVSNAALYAGIVLFIGNIFMAAISPVLGAYADQLSKRKYMLSLVTIFCLIFTYAITYKLTLIWVLVAFLLANLAYQIGLVIYDSMLPFIAKPQDVAKAGGFGIAFGYFGSFIAIGIAMYMSANDNGSTLDDEEYLIKLGYIPDYFPIVAFAFLILGLPLLIVQETRSEKPKRSIKALYRDTIDTLKTTAREIFGYRDTKYFMIGWLLFVDTANTIIFYMVIIITLGLGLDDDMVFQVMGIGIGSAVLFTYVVGWIGDKIGPKRNFFVVGGLWLTALVLAVFTNLKIGSTTTPQELAFLVGIVVGPAMGGTWVVQRQMITELAPSDRTSNYFGFANVFGRISSAVGPFVWWLSVKFFTVILDFGSGTATRLTILVIGALLIAGLYFISKVTDYHEEFLDGSRHVGNGVWKDKNGNVMN
ncbi:MAG: MFS transporter [Candidatus Kariarchaeaceae archaeon]|jgi:UMF1 family MFS transporter